MSERGGRPDPELTRPGWPRPRVDGWPVPWVSPSHALAQMAPARVKRIWHYRLCQVCGEGHADEDEVILVCNGLTEGTGFTTDVRDKTILSMDHSVLHRRCAQLAVKLCPRLKALKADHKLILVRTIAEHVAIFHPNEDPENHQVGVLGEHVTWVGEDL